MNLDKLLKIFPIVAVIIGGAWKAYTYFESRPAQPPSINSPTYTAQNIDSHAVVIQGNNISVNGNLIPIPQDVKIYLGFWGIQYSYTQTGGTCQFDGTAEFFETGDYNTRGVTTCDGVVNHEPVHLAFSALAAGTWVRTSDGLTLKENDIVTEIKAAEINQQSIAQRDLTRLNLANWSPVQKEFVKGESFSLKLMHSSRTALEFERYDQFAHRNFAVHMRRQ